MIGSVFALIYSDDCDTLEKALEKIKWVKISGEIRIKVKRHGISDLEALIELTHLSDQGLSDNNISNLEPIRSLSPSVLNLALNSIQDIFPLFAQVLLDENWIKSTVNSST